MATNYPGSFDDFTAISGEEMGDSVGGRTHEDFHNDANDAIEAIEGELGATPSGASATVAARLTGIEADVTAAEGDISTNTSDISTNTSDISTNTSDIATNTADIATNTGDISANATAVEGKANGTALDLLGLNGNYASTPYSAGMSITGDLDLRWFGSLNALTGSHSLISRYTHSGTQNTYMFASTSGDSLRLYRTTDGTTGAGQELNFSDSLSSFGLDMTSPIGVRVTWEQSSGLVKFWSSADNGLTWTQRGASQAGGTGVTFDSTTEPALIGTYNGTAWKLGGVTTRAEIRDGIDGTVVANPDFTQGTIGPDGAGNVWTLNGSGVYVYADGSEAPVFDVADVSTNTADIATNTGDISANATAVEGKANGTALSLPGVLGDDAKTLGDLEPSSTDVDVRWFGSLNDWGSPSLTSLITHGNDTSDYSWSVLVNTDGRIRVLVRVPGSSTLSIYSTVAPTVADGDTIGVRWVLDADTDSTFYTSTDDGVTWVQLGGVATTGVPVALHDEAMPVYVGSLGTSLYPADGTVKRAEVWSDGVLIANPDFTQGTIGPDGVGNVWTLNGSAGYVYADGSAAPVFDIGANTTAIEGKANGTALSLPGTTGNYAYSPPSAALVAMSDNVDVRATATLVDWTPASPACLISRYGASNSRSWSLNVHTDGTLVFPTTVDGVAIRFEFSSVPVPFADGDAGSIRATYDAGTGDVDFYTSTDAGVSWDQLGTTQSTAGGVLNSTASQGLHVGVAELFSGDQWQLAGEVHSAEVRDGIDGTVVANPDFTQGTIGKDGAGNVWTLNGSAGYVYAQGETVTVQGSYVDETVGRRAFTWDAVNGRWQMTYGDTGWRDIDGDLTNSWAAVGGKPKVRRIGQTVYLHVPFRLDGSSATADEFYILTSGFKPFASNTVGLGWLTSGQVTGTPSPAILYVGTAATGDLSCSSRDIRTTGSAEWITNDAWPASLPGVADGDIPSE